ncbi:hypothetical protein OJAV_G00023160 [Oryzias javanicus]|uniref:RNA polymerase II subunit M n=1 Tax=Oryzias javanicus TaxID=123683 RepID=A0A3S2PS32_ORYJA|nr:hypothetical protein OJAV_G00023160 [Oryzias javanicus]
MSSSWTEPQGKVGDLRNQSKEELRELLLKQEKILSNRRLLQTLPDRGKKVQDFAEKLRFAIEQRIEEERRRDQNQKREGEDSRERESTAKNTISGKQQDTSAAEHSHKSEDTDESELVEGLDRVQLSKSSTDKSKGQLKSRATTNYFLSKETQKKPHFVTVLDKGQSSSHAVEQKFKTNQLPNRNDVPPSESSPTGRSSGDALPLSAQARKEQDRKHLDDVTAAKLPPLRHNPAQLLTLEESAALLVEHTKIQQELRAKVAAQKLSEREQISMGVYTPDGGVMSAYREVHDEGAQLSSEED